MHEALLKISKIDVSLHYPPLLSLSVKNNSPLVCMEFC
jgi:hypothetical protein